MLHFVFFFTYALLGLIITGVKCNTPLPSQRPSCAVDSACKALETIRQSQDRVEKTVKERGKMCCGNFCTQGKRIGHLRTRPEVRK